MKKLIIYGCGKMGKGVLPVIQNRQDYEVIAYIDENADKGMQGDNFNNYHGIPIYPPVYIGKLKFDFVVIASINSGFVNEMRQVLKQNEILDSKILTLNLFAKKILIYGTGERAMEVFSWLNLFPVYQGQTIAFIDTNMDENLTGLKCFGISVYSPKAAFELEFDHVVIAECDPESVAEAKRVLEISNIPKDKVVDLGVLGYRDVRYYFIKGFAEYADHGKLEGNTAECGVYLGDSAMYINRFFKGRKLYLFDTFEGFDEGDISVERKLENKNFLEGEFNQIRFSNISSNEKISIVKNKMTYPENVIIKKGYFPDTASDVESEFCFVNLDMDLYKPILSGLRFFWGRMVQGGGILIHDYFHPELPGVEKAVSDFEKELGRTLPKTPIGDGCSILLIKQ